MTAPEWAVEKAARVMALVDDRDGCFERIDEWERTPEDERRDDDYPGSDYEDAEWWRKRARAALDAVWPETTTEWGVRCASGPVRPMRSEASARSEVGTLNGLFESDDWRPVSREVAEWREVQP